MTRKLVFVASLAAALVSSGPALAIQAGQCGNQIGSKFVDRTVDDQSVCVEGTRLVGDEWAWLVGGGAGRFSMHFEFEQR